MLDFCKNKYHISCKKMEFQICNFYTEIQLLPYGEIVHTFQYTFLCCQFCVFIRIEIANKRQPWLCLCNSSDLSGDLIFI